MPSALAQPPSLDLLLCSLMPKGWAESSCVCATFRQLCTSNWRKQNKKPQYLQTFTAPSTHLEDEKTAMLSCRVGWWERCQFQIFPEQKYDDSKLNKAIFQPRRHFSRNKNRSTPYFPEQIDDDSEFCKANLWPRLQTSRNKNRSTPHFPRTKLRRLQIEQGDLSTPTPLFPD